MSVPLLRETSHAFRSAARKRVSEFSVGEWSRERVSGVCELAMCVCVCVCVCVRVSCEGASFREVLSEFKGREREKASECRSEFRSGAGERVNESDE